MQEAQYVRVQCDTELYLPGGRYSAIFTESRTVPVQPEYRTPGFRSPQPSVVSITTCIANPHDFWPQVHGLD
jgi:hypothetical protein